MTIPTLCKAGYVCDTVGTIMPINPCPQGHYCLAGTATSLGDCCATGPALGHAAVVDPGLPASIDTIRTAIEAWNDPSAMKYVDRYKPEYQFPMPRWLPPLEAAKKQEGTYTCGTGPDTLKKPCCSCYSRPRGAKAEQCAQRIADYRRGFDESSFECGCV